MSMPLSQAEGTIAVTEVKPSEVEIRLAFDYDVKYGPIGWLMNAAMIQPMMNGMFDQVLAGLTHHLETGEIVVDDTTRVPAAA